MLSDETERRERVLSMNDVAIAGVLFAFLVALAVAAPIWGADSRDGFEGNQALRRFGWLRHD
jgi:hypothetical protein